jgi:hypothetical protein
MIDYLKLLTESAERVATLEEDVKFVLQAPSARFTVGGSESDYKPGFATHTYCWMLDSTERKTGHLSSRHFGQAVQEFAHLILPRMVELAKAEDAAYRARVLEEAKLIVNTLGEK